jgi:hypothetical protein
MATQYPDVMNDLTVAQQRFEAGCVQYLAEFSAGPLPAGSVAQLVLTLQNTVDAPAPTAVRFALPRLRGRLRRMTESLFQIQESVLRLTLSEGEVGQVIVPVRVATEVPPGSYTFGVHVESVTHEGANRARLESRENEAQGLAIRHPQGLGISQLLSWGYEAQRKADQSVVLTVVAGETGGGGAQEGEGLSPRYVSVWMPENWDPVTVARRELNERRLHVLSELAASQLFADFLRVSKDSFARVGIELELGEALFVAKMLTYTATYFLGVPAWEDCLLVPIFAYARSEALPTVDVRSLVAEVGYLHVLELAIALAFPLIEEMLRREPWQAAEQRALRDLVLQCQASGAALPVEFLYLPLILGGLVVARDLVLEGEDVQQSLDLLCTAKKTRAEWFADPELAELNDVFEELLTRQMSG